MDITPPLAADARVIRSYGAHELRIAETMHALPLVVTAQAISPIDATTIEQLHSALLLHVHTDTELLLIGTGAKAQWLSPQQRQEWRAKGIAVETMDNGAACRTYNVLLAEGRKVAIALLRAE